MQILREYKGNNASAKMINSKEEAADKRIVFIDVIPYPTLMFESR